jgi:HAMP domain-containing protein
VAQDSAIRRVLRAAQHVDATSPVRATPNDSTSTQAFTAARTALARLAVSADSALPIELWTDDGHSLIRLAHDSLSATTRELPELSPSAMATGTGVVRPDSVRVGAFYESGGRVYFGISTPVYDGAQRLGYLAELHRVSAQPSAEQALRELMGEAVTGRYRNLTGTFWSTLGGVQVAPVQRFDSSSTDPVFEATEDDTSRLFATEAAIRGTAWAIVLELPVSGVLARPHATIVRLGLISLLLIVLGAAGSWVISRHITQPLATLSDAAEALAHGDVTRYVDASGGDEVAHLAHL